MQTKKQKTSPIKQRILQYAATLGISKRDFYTRIGVSRGTLESATGITEDVMAKFIAKYPDINLEWLLTGHGDMLKSETVNPIATDTPVPADNIDRPKARPLTTIWETTNIKPIPLVAEKAAAGFGNGNFSIEEKDVKEYYVIPKFRCCKVDFMIEVSGLSMYPHFIPGDVIACTILTDRKFLQWNKCHVIATREQGIIVKRLMPSAKDGYITMVSDNKEYPAFDVPFDEITGLALVVGSVSLE